MENRKYHKQLSRFEKRNLVATRLKQHSELSDRVIARQLGISHSLVGKIRTELGLKIRLGTQEDTWSSHPYLKANPEIVDKLTPRALRAIKAPGVVDKMAEQKSKSPVYAQRLLLKEKKAEKEKAAAEMAAAGYELYVADITEGLPMIGDESIDAIVTDIPYDASSVSVSLALSNVAGRVLKPSGSLVVMCGQTYMVDVINALCSDNRIVYRWVISYSTPQRANNIRPQRVYSRWKPIIILTKGNIGWNSLGDTITAPPDKSDAAHHPHSQSVEGMASIVERFTQIGDTVLDPCCGGGTTGIACAKLQRNFAGCDKEEQWVRVARERIEQCLRNVDGDKFAEQRA